MKGPSKYIQELHNCVICLESPSQPMQCKGCKTVFCKKCSDKWLEVNRKCPLKCTDRWSLEAVVIKINCPFSQKCQSVLNPYNFEQHLSKCLYNKSLEKQNIFDIHYLCLQRHPLQYFSKLQHNKKLRQECTECLEQAICRSGCETCFAQMKPSLYCCHCKIPSRMSSRRCPLNHQLKITKEKLNFLVCDFCGNCVQKMGMNYCFHDDVCDLTVCMECQTSLPIRRRSSG